MTRFNRTTLTCVLALCCGLAGHAYYRMNPRDPIVAIIFAVGLLGIVLSVLRNSKSK